MLEQAALRNKPAVAGAGKSKQAATPETEPGPCLARWNCSGDPVPRALRGVVVVLKAAL